MKDVVTDGKRGKKRKTTHEEAEEIVNKINEEYNSNFKKNPYLKNLRKKSI